jgi:hypothetical protein
MVVAGQRAGASWVASKGLERIDDRDGGSQNRRRRFGALDKLQQDIDTSLLVEGT